MPLPIIENIEPVVEPAVEERNYDAMYNTLLVSRYIDGKQNLRMGFKPYDATNDVVADTGEIMVQIEDLYTEAASRPVVGEVLAAITALAAKFCIEKQLQNKIESLEDSAEKDNFQDQLDALQSELTTITLAELFS